MGEVWKARDTRLDRTAALKASKEQFTERFEREARAVAALNHPNICTLHDVGPNYLVMELVEGEPLKGPMPAEKAVAYAGQILDALDAAHRKGITHRDLKPNAPSFWWGGPPGPEADRVVGFGKLLNEKAGRAQRAPPGRQTWTSAPRCCAARLWEKLGALT